MPGQRFDRLDALRTLAMVWMTLFHFSFDLNHFKLIPPQNFYADPFWTGQRTAIVSLFLFTAGVAQAIALQQQGLLLRPALQRLDVRFWRRWLKIAGCALLVTLGSVVMFPASFIYFGVLHGLAVMLIVARLTVGWGQGLWLAGAVVIGLNHLAPIAHASVGGLGFLHDKSFNWLGLIAQKPITEDYVPLVPWLAAIWWGLATGLWIMQHHPAWLRPQALSAWEKRWLPMMALPGCWSLSYYMLHQPVLIGALMGWVALRPV